MCKSAYFLFLNLFFVINLFAMKPSDFLTINPKYISDHFPSSVFCYTDSVINNEFDKAPVILNKIVPEDVASNMFGISDRSLYPSDISLFKSKFISSLKDKSRFEKFYSVNQYLTANILGSFCFYCGYFPLGEIPGLDKVNFKSFDILEHIDDINDKVIEKAVTKLRKSRKKVVTKQRQTKITDFFKPKKANIQ